MTSHLKEATKNMTVEQSNNFRLMVDRYIIGYAMSTREAVEFAQYIRTKRSGK